LGKLFTPMRLCHHAV